MSTLDYRSFHILRKSKVARKSSKSRLVLAAACLSINLLRDDQGRRPALLQENWPKQSWNASMQEINCLD